MSADPALGCDPELAADFLRALAHPMRLRILCRLLDGECAVAGFESGLGLKQPNLSQQLAALRDAGLVATRRESKSVVYRLADPRVERVLAALRAAMAGDPPAATAPRPAAPAPTPAPPAAAPEAPRRPVGEAGLFAMAGWDLPHADGSER
jgi:DNA-binding transcriptional ArsR family regulator